MGESGKFKISVNITNNQSKTVFINNEKRNIYLPLLTAAELTLSNSNLVMWKLVLVRLLMMGIIP